jgi:hypothetical protein
MKEKVAQSCTFHISKQSKPLNLINSTEYLIKVKNQINLLVYLELMERIDGKKNIMTVKRQQLTFSSSVF